MSGHGKPLDALTVRDKVARALYNHDKGWPRLALGDASNEDTMHYYLLADAALAAHAEAAPAYGPQITCSHEVPAEKRCSECELDRKPADEAPKPEETIGHLVGGGECWCGETHADIHAASGHSEPAPGLREALQRIVDTYEGCACDCDDENCCAKVGEPCPLCIARAALTAPVPK